MTYAKQVVISLKRCETDKVTRQHSRDHRQELFLVTFSYHQGNFNVQFIAIAAVELWRGSNVVRRDGHINEVTLRRALLVLGLVTVSGYVTSHSG